MALSRWEHYTITGASFDDTRQWWSVATSGGFSVVIAAEVLPDAPRLGDSLSINGYDGHYITACAYGEKLLWDDRAVKAP